tara:strand:+ start:6063 stop:6746 length:684 start_codon:yes stop_codon:yes gene_type:complete
MDDDSRDMTDDAALQAFRQMQEEARERHAEVMSRLGDTPDYAPSLAVIQKALDFLVERGTHPLTVEEVMEQVVETTTDLSQPTRDALAEARAAMLESCKAMEVSREAHVRESERARSVRDQARQNHRRMAVGAVAGAIGMMILPGMIAHVAPANWLLPERLAARTLRLSIADAGLHLLVVANPLAATEIVQGAQILLANREAIARCRSKSRQGDATLSCRITLPSMP